MQAAPAVSDCRSCTFNMIRKIGRILEDAWVYLGSLAAMALLVGVLGMGIYHMMTWREDSGHIECFRGAVNTPDASLPVGLSPLPDSVADSGETAHIRFEYADDGRLRRLAYVDASGEVTPMPGSRVAEQRIRYDDKGRVSCKANYDGAGEPAADAAGVASRHFFYDERGNCVRTELRDADGALVCARLPGYAVATTRYDERNRPLVTAYLNEKEQPTVNALGESRVEYAYDETAHEMQRRNYVGEALAVNRLGYAIEKHTMSDGNRLLRVEWLDAQQQPVYNASAGAAVVCTKRSPGGADTLELYGGCDGALRGCEPVCAARLVHCDLKGRPEWERYQNAEGRPQMNEALGYAERHCRYREDGALASETFLDAGGHPASCAERHYPLHRADEAPMVLTLHRDGRTALRPLEPALQLGR